MNPSVSVEYAAIQRQIEGKGVRCYDGAEDSGGLYLLIVNLIRRLNVKISHSLLAALCIFVPACDKPPEQTTTGTVEQIENEKQEKLIIISFREPVGKVVDEATKGSTFEVNVGSETQGGPKYAEFSVSDGSGVNRISFGPFSGDELEKIWKYFAVVEKQYLDIKPPKKFSFDYRPEVMTGGSMRASIGFDEHGRNGILAFLDESQIDRVGMSVVSTREAVSRNGAKPDNLQAILKLLVTARKKMITKE